MTSNFDVFDLTASSCKFDLYVYQYTTIVAHNSCCLVHNMCDLGSFNYYFYFGNNPQTTHIQNTVLSFSSYKMNLEKRSLSMSFFLQKISFFLQKISCFLSDIEQL